MTNLQDLWPQLQADLNLIADDVRTQFPSVWVSSGSRATEVFPLRAHLSLTVGDAKVSEEGVVFSVSFRAVGNAVLFVSDIAAGDGQILVDGPAREFDPSESDRSELEWARDCIAEALSFANANMQVLEDALR